MNSNMTPAALNALLDGNVENFLAAATPGGIEAQEKRGQSAFVQSMTLPKRGAEDRAPWESLGFKFGEDADDIFVNVEFPKGWAKRATDHSMWSEIFDDKGRKRAGVFYKAAFYDRSAHVAMERRYRVGTLFSKQQGGPIEVRVEDADGTILFNAGGCAYADYVKSDELRDICAKWLDSNFPDWKSMVAYW